MPVSGRRCKGQPLSISFCPQCQSRCDPVGRVGMDGQSVCSLPIVSDSSPTCSGGQDKDQGFFHISCDNSPRLFESSCSEQLASYQTTTFQCACSISFLVKIWSPESQPVIAFTQGELRTSIKRVKCCIFSSEISNVRCVFHRSKDTGVECIQPGSDAFHPVGVECGDGPDASGRSAQEEPAQVLFGVKIQIRRRF